MPCIGIDCDIRKEKVSFFECSVCDRCKKFPDLLKKKFLFPSIRSGNPRISVTMLTSCPRQAYLKMTRDFYISRNGIISTNIGTALHEYIQGSSDISEKFIRWVTPEGHECVGYLDALNIFKRILYDLKTTAHGWRISDHGAKGQDKLQLQIYATILKNMHRVDLHALKLIYVGLGDKECLEVEVPYEDKSKFINQKTNLLQRHLEEGTVPKGEPMWPEWECGYCQFSNDCPDKVVSKKVYKSKQKPESSPEPAKDELPTEEVKTGIVSETEKDKGSSAPREKEKRAKGLGGFV